MSGWRNMPEKKTAAHMKRILRGFWGNDRETQRCQIHEVMAVLDHEEKVWRRDKPATRDTLH